MSSPVLLTKTGITNVTHSQLLVLLRSRLGLILGPTVVHGPGTFELIASAVASEFKVEAVGTFLDTADKAISANAAAADVSRTIRECVMRLPTSPNIARLGEVRWSAVLSGCLSETFEERFRQATDRHPLGHAVTVYEDPSRSLPPRTVPVFKLLGSTLRNAFAHSTVTYRRRRSLWVSALKQFADQTQGGFVLCIGMAECPWLLLDLLGAMTAAATSTPRALLLSAQDPLLRDPSILESVQGVASLAAVDATESAIVSAAAGVAVRPVQPVTVGAAASTPRSVSDFAEFAILVNDQSQVPHSGAEERHRLLDLLFSPGRPSWEPFLYDLDLRRTLTSPMLARFGEQIAAGSVSVGCVVTGGAGSGKTTLLRRVALELARQGTLSLWLRPWPYQDGHRVLKALLATLAATAQAESPVVFFIDDPASFGAISAEDVLNAAEAQGLRAIVVAALRTSEWATTDSSRLFGSWELLAHYEVPDSLDDWEWALLPAALVKLGISGSDADAQRSIEGAPSRLTRDTLSTLYWLLPSTREAISRSIQDEYFRLGDGAGLTQVIVGSYQASSTLLQEAYAMAAVADRYQAPLPIEVLVSALGVSYGDWLDATPANGSAWGLLYPSGDPTADAPETTVYYSTRNSIVTDVLIGTINGGGLGHSGELRILSSLLRGCTGTQGIYREFAVRVLVPWKRLHHKLTYQEGLSLHEIAEQALPFPDKTLLHHKGLWMTNAGNDPIQATVVLEKALQTAPFPYADRKEANEHIHTSLAATALDALKQGLISIDEARDRVLSELAKARSSHFFNPRAAHVEATLILSLRKRLGPAQLPDQISMTTTALSNVDRTLLLLIPSRTSSADAPQAKDVQMLTSVRGELLTTGLTDEQLESYAEELWEKYGRQDGYVIVGRRLYGDAYRTKRGSDYNLALSYVTVRIDRIAARHEVPAAALLELALHIYYAWKIHRMPASAPLAEGLDWNWCLRTVEAVMQSGDVSRSPFHSYLRAVAFCQLDNWAAGLAIFAEMRREGPTDLWTPRDYLLSPDGRARQVQGEVKAVDERRFYIYVPDLHQDFLARRGDSWPRTTEIVHAYVAFAFAGPMAVRQPL